jgi:hypothetical protein
VYYLYEGREIAPGVSIGFNLAGVPVSGLVASVPRVIRYIPQDSLAEAQ